jgi:hypothetical protein
VFRTNGTSLTAGKAWPREVADDKRYQALPRTMKVEVDFCLCARCSDWARCSASSVRTTPAHDL